MGKEALVKQKQTTEPEPIEGAVLTTEQAAALLQLSPSTLVLWRQKGEPELPFVRCGRRIRYMPTDLEAFLNQHRVAPDRGQ